MVDESGRPIEGAQINLMQVIAQSYTVIAQTYTDREGKASVSATDASGANLSISIHKEGYEPYASDIPPISSVIITMKKLPSAALQ